MVREKMIVERHPLTIAVTDMNTRKLLRLSYQEIDPCINYRETGKPDSSISFRLDKTSVPSATLMYSGMPRSAQDLAVSLMIGLTRF